MTKRKGKRRVEQHPSRRREHEWGRCEGCGQDLPLVPESGMCGPCTFGEADTLLLTSSEEA